MTFLDAARALDDLASGRMPSQTSVSLGLNSLDSLLLSGGGEQLLHDAAATLELFIATGGVVSNFENARTRYALMAAAVRRALIDD